MKILHYFALTHKVLMVMSNLDDKGVDGHKKVKGRKRHIVTDVLGLIFFAL